VSKSRGESSWRSLLLIAWVITESCSILSAMQKNRFNPQECNKIVCSRLGSLRRLRSLGRLKKGFWEGTPFPSPFFIFFNVKWSYKTAAKSQSLSTHVARDVCTSTVRIIAQCCMNIASCHEVRNYCIKFFNVAPLWKSCFFFLRTQRNYLPT